MADLVGSNVDPRLSVLDYSGYANAARTQSAGILNSINGVAGAVADYGKEQKESKNKLKASQMQIDAAIKLFPDQAPYLSSIANELKNEDAPLTDRAAMAEQVAGLIQMGVGQKRYETELAFKQQDQQMQERESALRNQATALQIQGAQGSMNDATSARALDAKTKTTIGPALLEQVLNMAPPSIAENIRKNSGSYTDEEKYSLASSVMGLIPKSERAKAPQVQDVPTGDGGSLKMQWDENAEKWTPIQTTVANPDPSALAADKLPAGLQPYAGAFVAAGQKYGVDPKALAAISMHETANGTSSAFRNKNNAMGISDNSGPVDTGTVENSIDRMARLLAAGQKGEGPYAGKSTIGEIAGTYAPVGASNDPRGLNGDWASGVSANIKRLGGNPAAPIGYTPPPGQTLSPKDAQAMEFAQQDREKQSTDATAARASSITKANDMIATVDKLAAHPGFKKLFGSNLPIVDGITIPGSTHIAGTEGASARAVYDQIKGKLFLDGITSMKGMGALSDAEGAKVAAAASDLTEKQGDLEAMKSLVEIKRHLLNQIAAIKAEDPAAANRASGVTEQSATAQREANAASLRALLGK